jgi:hypothetical protein
MKDVVGNVILSSGIYNHLAEYTFKFLDWSPLGSSILKSYTQRGLLSYIRLLVGENWKTIIATPVESRH